MGWMDGYGHMTGWAWFGMFFVWAFWIALFFLILFAIARLSQRPGDFRRGMPREDEAPAILRARDARGGSDKQAYEERLEDLTP